MIQTSIRILHSIIVSLRKPARMTSRLRFISHLFFLLGVASAVGIGQQDFTQEQLLDLLKRGKLDNMSPAEIREKMKQAGVSEQQLRVAAKARKIDISKYLKEDAQDSAVQAHPVRRDTVYPASPILLAPGAIAQPPDVERTLPPDTVPIPKGEFGLEYYGYNIFKSVPSAFEPAAVGPVDPGYLVSPSDRLRLSVWGQTEFQYELDVDREGKIFIPNVGQVFVAGTSLERLELKLKNQLSKFYSGLAESPPSVFMDVTIAELRPLRVFVMGEVRQPGGYTISSYATVFNALYAVGGPLVTGSLRTIRVLRENKVVAVVDLYDYMVKGDQSSDVRLQNNDVIFVPPREITVSVRGDVHRPAIYELKSGEGLRTAIEFAGGLLPTALLSQAQIDRVKPFSARTGGVEDREVIDVDLRSVVAEGGKDIPVFDSDDVRIFSILDEKRNYVTITGSVWRPGRYELAKAGSLRSLISEAQGLQPKTYMGVGHILRLNEDLLTRRTIPFDLAKVVEESSPDIRLEERDEVLIYSSEVTEIKEQFVEIRGEVKKPGRYPLSTDLTLGDLVMMAGGFTQEAYSLEAEVSRINPEGLRGDSLSIILHPKLPVEFSVLTGAVLIDSSRDASEHFFLQHRDQINIFPNPFYVTQKNVRIEGDITYPGTYSLRYRGERLSELLERAGGPLKTSYFGGAEFYRGGRRLLVDFADAYYNKGTQNDVVMLEGDRLIIPSHPHTVIVNGEVNNPGMLSFLEENDVSDYLDRAGGLTDSASYAILIKPTGESERVNFGWFRSNPEVPEGSTITVYQIPPPLPEGQGFDVSGTIKDTFAILTSAATVAFIVWQVTQ